MRHFRRKVITLLFFTCFLLFVAWVTMILMKHRGDWQAVLRELENQLPFKKRDIEDFFRDQVLPWAEAMGKRIRQMLPSG